MCSSDAELGVGRELPAGHDAAVPEGAGGQQQVLAGGVDRRTVAVAWCRAVAHEAGQDEHGHRLVGVDVVLHGAGHARLGRVGLGAGSLVVAVGLPLGRPEPARALADQPLGLAGHRPVGEDDEAEGLAVRPARGPGGGEEDVAQRLVGDRLVGVAPDGPGREQALVERDLSAPARSPFNGGSRRRRPRCPGFRSRRRPYQRPAGVDLQPRSGVLSPRADRVGARRPGREIPYGSSPEFPGAHGLMGHVLRADLQPRGRSPGLSHSSPPCRAAAGISPARRGTQATARSTRMPRRGPHPQW